jgi:integrase
MLLRKQGKTQLFPDLFGHKAPPSHTPGRKLNEWLKKIGIKGSEEKGKKTFHSFRHTFINRTKELSLDRELCSEIAGHSEGRNSARSIYAKPARAKQLYDEIISKMHYDLDLTHLKEYMDKMGDDPWDKKQKTKMQK